MKLSQFKFKLPEEKIALHPTKYRDESRLLVLHRKTGEIEHKMFKDVLDYFDDKDVFIFNDTKVFPARLYGNKEKTGARIEVFLLRELNEELRLWDVLVDPARKIRIGNKLYFGDDDSMVAEVIDNTTSRGRTLRFLYDGPHDEFKKALYALGETPLPHSIINRPVEPDDAERFQSIFARNEGAVTAPTASLHFSRELMKRMEIKGIDFAYITLHAGLGNFRDIDVEDLTKHKTDSEQMIVNEEAVRIVNHAKDLNRQVCAVGTTVMRAIESTVSTDGHLKEYEGWTNKFIFPPYDFTVANAMISNFHMPHENALSVLDRVKKEPGRYGRILTFYYLYHTTYLSCYSDEMEVSKKQLFMRQIRDYKDTLVAISDPNTASYVTNQCGRLGLQGKWDEAIRILTGYYERCTDTNPDKARVEYLLAELYLGKRDIQQAKHFLIRASITDITNAKKVYMSLQQLAILLFQEGDIARAYNYISCSLEDVNFGKARYRIIDIAEYLPIIKAANDSRIKADRDRVLFFLLALSVLVIALVIVFFFLRKKNHNLLKVKEVVGRTEPTLTGSDRKSYPDERGN